MYTYQAISRAHMCSIDFQLNSLEVCYQSVDLQQLWEDLQLYCLDWGCCSFWQFWNQGMTKAAYGHLVFTILMPWEQFLEPIFLKWKSFDFLWHWLMLRWHLQKPTVQNNSGFVFWLIASIQKLSLKNQNPCHLERKNIIPFQMLILSMLFCSYKVFFL